METPRDNWSLYKRLFAYVRPYRGRLIGGIVFGVLYGPANGVVLSVVRKAWAWAFESNWSYSWWQIFGIAVLLGVFMRRSLSGSGRSVSWQWSLADQARPG